MSERAPLPLQPPRPYPLREAYRGRIWRDRAALLCRDLVILGVATGMAGVAFAESAFILLGGAVATVAFALQQLATWAANRQRVAIIAAGPSVQGRLKRPRPVYLLGELFRGSGSRTYTLPYTFELPSGEIFEGRLMVCGCARHFLPADSVEWIAYDPERPKRSLPLRAAVMVRPR